jgi:hypothetical protein
MSPRHSPAAGPVHISAWLPTGADSSGREIMRGKKTGSQGTAPLKPRPPGCQLFLLPLDGPLALPLWRADANTDVHANWHLNPDLAFCYPTFCFVSPAKASNPSISLETGKQP